MKKKDFLMYAFISFIAVGTLSSCSNSDDDIIPDIPPSEGTVMTLEGKTGTDASANVVYVDFSTEQSTAIARNSWTLGFDSGSDYKVILNNYFSVTAIETEFDEIDEVNTENVDINELAIGINYQTGSIIGSFDLIDDTTGNYSTTVIKPISSTASENKVYLVNAVGGSTVNPDNVYKIKVNRTANGYSLVYGKIGDTETTTLEISKDDEYSFQYVSLQGGNIVNNEPKKAEWDLLWGYNMYFTAFGPNNVPYGMADFVQINSLGGVKVAQVLADETPYENFSESDVASITFSSSKNYIGANWRTVGQSSSSVKEDRYYVIQDTAGNIYKLKFNSMGNDDGGERGRPQIEFKLVKRG